MNSEHFLKNKGIHSSVINRRIKFTEARNKHGVCELGGKKGTSIPENKRMSTPSTSTFTLREEIRHK